MKTAQKTSARAAAEEALFDAAERLLVEVGYAGITTRRLARRHGVELLGRAVSADGRSIGFAGGRSVQVQSVVWATGFRPDYSWIDVPSSTSAARRAIDGA